MNNDYLVIIITAVFLLFFTSLILLGTNYYKHQNTVFLECVQVTKLPLECSKGLNLE